MYFVILCWKIVWKCTVQNVENVCTVHVARLHNNFDTQQYCILRTVQILNICIDDVFTVNILWSSVYSKWSTLSHICCRIFTEHCHALLPIRTSYVFRCLYGLFFSIPVWKFCNYTGSLFYLTNIVCHFRRHLNAYM